MRMQTGVSLMMAAVLGTGMAIAQDQQGGAMTPGTAAPGGAMMSADTNAHPSDAMFVKKAIRGNEGEIDAAKLALQKSRNQQVKDFAQKMVDDHTKMLDQLKQVAQQDNIQYVDKPSAMAMQLHTKLEGLDGAAFDKAYVNGMVTDHKGDVRDFNMEIHHGTKQEVKDAASQSLPTIKEHLQIVEGIQKSMGA